MPFIKKILYIKRNVDEKRSCAMLERSTRQLPCPVSFMVTTNCFFGLECAEHTYYDLIIAENDFKDLCFLDMKKILRAVGNKTPLILLESEEDPRCEIHGEFSGILKEPFSASDLCKLIQKHVHFERSTGCTNPMTNSISSSDNTTVATSNTLTDLDSGTSRRRTRQAQLDVVDEGLPTTFDTQITFGIEGAKSVIPPTLEVSADIEEQETINVLSHMSTAKASVTTKIGGVGSKLEAIQYVFDGKMAGTNHGHIHGLLEKLSSEKLFQSTASMSASSSTDWKLPNHQEIRQLHLDFDFEKQQQHQASTSNVQVQNKRKVEDTNN